MAIRPNKPVRGFAALGTAAPVDGVVLAADSVAVPEGAAAEADLEAGDLADAEVEDLTLLTALARVLAIALVVSAVPLAVVGVGEGVATAKYTPIVSLIFPPKNKKKKKRIPLTTPHIPHKCKSPLAQTSSPASQITLPALSPRRGYQDGGVAVPLVASQAGGLGEEGARAAGGPEDAVGTVAALR
jgi:hypothetical protein